MKSNGRHYERGARVSYQRHWNDDVDNLKKFHRYDTKIKNFRTFHRVIRKTGFLTTEN
jgi:hypothetical protein